MEEKVAQSVTRWLKAIFWVILPGSLSFTAFACILIYYELDIPSGSGPEEIRIIAAQGDLAVGDTIAPTNLRLLKVSADDVPKNSIRPDDGRVILRHKIIRPVKHGEYLDWYDTDIPIPRPDKETEIPNKVLDATSL